MRRLLLVLVLCVLFAITFLAQREALADQPSVQDVPDATGVPMEPMVATPFTNVVQVTSMTFDGTSISNHVFDLRVDEIVVEFSLPMSATAGHSLNYRLYEAGLDATLESNNCSQVIGDDQNVSLDVLGFVVGDSSVTIRVNDGDPLPFGDYVMLACTSLTSQTELPLDGNNDNIPGDPSLSYFSIKQPVQLESIYVIKDEVVTPFSNGDEVDYRFIIEAHFTLPISTETGTYKIVQPGRDGVLQTEECYPYSGNGTDDADVRLVGTTSDDDSIVRLRFWSPPIEAVSRFFMCGFFDENHLGLDVDGDGVGGDFYRIDFTLRRNPYILDIYTNVGDLYDFASTNLHEITFEFSEAMADLPGDNASNDVTNPQNYRLIEYGTNSVLETDGCGPIIGDDIVIPVDSALYDATNNAVTISLNNGQTVPFGAYSVLVCPSLEDASGAILDGNGNGYPGDAYIKDFVNDVDQPGPIYEVNTTSEMKVGNCGISHCTLGEALYAAGRSSHTYPIINLQPSATYELTTPQIVVNGDESVGLVKLDSGVTLNGNGATIQRSYAPDTAPFRLLQVTASTSLPFIPATINDLTFRNGLSDYGGAISGSDFTVNNSTFEDNQGVYGGAIYGDNISITDTTFRHNVAVQATTATGTIHGGRGGAIYVTDDFVLIDSTLEQNRSENEGGAGYILADNTPLLLERNLFYQNEANDLRRVYGGQTKGSVLYLRDVEGGHIINNTFVENGATVLSTESRPGAAIFIARTFPLNIWHNTFVNNSNRAIELYNASSPVSFFGNIIYGEGQQCQDGDQDDPDIGEASLGYNVSNSASCLDANLANGDILADPLLLTLADNGGPTQTIALDSASPALDLIPQASCQIFEDQRGVIRPVDGNDDSLLDCDAGAYESPNLNTSSADLSLTLIEPENDPTDAGPYTVRATLRNDGPDTADYVSVIFTAENASPAFDQNGFDANSGRWQVQNLLSGQEVTIDVPFRLDRQTKNLSLVIHAEVELSLLPDPDSIPNNGILSEDDYAAITRPIGCSIVPETVLAGDVVGVNAAIYAANDETCNPGPDTFALAPQSTYLVNESVYEEFHDGYLSDTINRVALLPIESDITINGQGALFDFDEDAISMWLLTTMPGSSLTLNDLVFQQSQTRGQANLYINSEGNLYIHRAQFLDMWSYDDWDAIIFHSDGNLLIQDTVFENIGYFRTAKNLIRITNPTLSRIERTSFISNVTDNGLIQLTAGYLDILNSTFAANQATPINGMFTSSITVDQSTFSQWHTAAFMGGGDFTVSNSIFDHMYACADTYYGIISAGHNLLSSTSDEVTSGAYLDCGFTHPTDIVAYFGLPDTLDRTGLTPVLVPAEDMAGVNVIPPEACQATTDQRGVVRPFNGACDVGAVELGADDIQITPLAPQISNYTSESITLSLPSAPYSDGMVYIERRNVSTNGNWDDKASYPIEQTTYADTYHLVCNSTYAYRIYYQYSDNARLSPYSPPVTVSTLSCEQPITHTFGLYKEGRWLFYTLDGDARYDARFQWGPQEPGWQAIVGDWNGDGIDGIGLYKNGHWLLRSVDIAGNVTDSELNFGDSSDVYALAGDWDGDGIDTPGLYSAGYVKLRNSNSSGLPDLEFQLSNSTLTALPIVGDWDGDGVDTLGTKDKSVFRIYYLNTSSNYSYRYVFGPSDYSWRPIAGDWDDDGIDTYGIYNAGLWRVRNSHSSIDASVDVGFNYGDLERGWQPLGNFDSSPAILNLLFAATVPTPRVPVIPGPELPIPTEGVPDSQPPSVEDILIEPTSISSITSTPELMPTQEVETTPEPSNTPEPSATISPPVGATTFPNTAPDT